MKAKRLISMVLVLVSIFSLGFSAVFAEDAGTGGTTGGLDVSKTLDWSSADKTHASVIVTSDVPDLEDTKVLFLGTLCTAHSMSSDTIEKSINAIAHNAEVTYYLLAEDNGDGRAANFSDISLVSTGTIARNSTMSTAQETAYTSALDTGNHSALKGFIAVLYDELVTKGKEYDYIVLEFDGSRIARKVQTAIADITDGTGKKIVDVVAGKLKDYYDAEKVIWITDGYRYDGSVSADDYGVTPYCPRNYYYYSSDKTKGWLSAQDLHLLCSVFAPDYYLAHADKTDTNYYGDGENKNDFALSDDYKLTVAVRNKEDHLYGTAANSYMVYSDDSRQTYYNNAAELSDFLYMAIHGVTMSFSDKIKVSESDTVKVTGVTLYATTSAAADARSVADADWIQRYSLTITNSSTLNTATDGTKYYQDDSGKIKVTAGNTTASENNLVTVSNVDMKKGVKYTKLVINLEDSEGFKSCISVKRNDDGTPVVVDGKTVYVMNPNDGNADVDAYSGGSVSSGGAGTDHKWGDGAAAGVDVAAHKVNSTVTDGTNDYKDTFNNVSARTDAIEETTIDGDSATLNYAPSVGYFLDSIKLDGSSTPITLSSGSYTSTATGKEATVTAAADGSVKVTLPNLTQDRSVAVEYSRISLVKAVTTPADITNPVSLGDPIVYTITVTNEGSVERSGIAVSDVIDTTLVKYVSDDSGGVYDAATKTVSWSNITLAAGATKTIALNVEAIADLTTDNSVKNKATGTYGGLTISDSNEITVPFEPRDIKVTYHYVGTTPAGVDPAEGYQDIVSYGNTYTAKTAATINGYTFAGWYTDNGLTAQYTDGTTPSEDVNLYGRYTPIKDFDIVKSVSLEGSAISGAVPPGSKVSYSIAVTNKNAYAEIKDVVVTDTVPAGLTVDTATISPGGNLSSGVITWTVTVPADETKTLSFEATVPSDITGAQSYANVATIATADGETIGQSSDSVSFTAKPLWKVDSAVTHGTNAYTDATDTVAAQTGAISETAFDGDTVTLTYAPDPDYALDSITVDGTKIELKDGAYSSTTEGYGVNVSKDAAGNVTVTLPAIKNDRSVNVVYKINSLKIIKAIQNITNTTVKGGAVIEYKITVINEGSVARNGITVTDVIDTSLVSFVSADNGGAYDADSKTVTWTGIDLGVKPGADAPEGTVDTSNKELTLKVRVLEDLTGEKTIPNYAGGSYNGEAIPDSNTETLNAIGRDVTVSYSVSGSIPEGFTTPADQSATYGNTVSPAAVSEVPGYSFRGWSTVENSFTADDAFDSSKALTEENYPSLKTDNKLTLYGTWEYCVGLEKSLVTAVSADKPLRGGDSVEYQIAVSNTSTAKVTGVTVTDTLDGNLSYVKDSASPAAFYDSNAKTLTWSNLEVEANSTVTLKYTVKIKEDITTTTDIPNTAYGSHQIDADKTKTFSSDELKISPQPKLFKAEYSFVGAVPDKDLKAPATDKDIPYGTVYTAKSVGSVPTGYKFSGWCTDPECTQTYDPAAMTADLKLYGKWTPQKDFSVSKGVSYEGNPITDAIAPNSTVTYTVYVTNNNTAADIKDVVVTDTVPAGLTVTEADIDKSVTNRVTLNDGVITWTVNLDAGETKSLSFTATVPDIKVQKSYSNVATLVSADGESVNKDSAPADFTVKPANITIAVTKAWSDGWAAHSGESVYVRLYANDKLKDFITLTESSPSWSSAVEAYDASGNTIKYSFREVNLSGTETVLENGNMTGPGNRYKVSYATNDGTTVISNNYVIDADDLEFDKTADTTAKPGESFVYTITLKNKRTNETATDIVVNDTLPAGLTLAAEEGLVTALPAEAKLEDGVIVWTVPSLAGGASAELKIKVNVPADATAEEYENVASITKVGDTSYPVNTVPSKKAITDVRTFSVKKTWSNPDIAHGAVTVQLKQNGADYGKPQSVDSTNSWSYTWTGLPMYNSDNVKYTYTVVELPVEGYSAAVTYSGAENGNTGAEIKNTLLTYTVRYELKGSDIPQTPTAPGPDTVNHGDTYNAKDALSAENYKFTGWCTDPECTVPYSPTAITADTTLYGKWERETGKVSEEIGTKGGPDSSEVEYAPTETVKKGDYVPVPEAPKYAGDDYTFEGWYLDPDCTLPFTGKTSDGEELKLYALWSKNPQVKYSFVGYVPNGTATPPTEKVSTGAGYNSSSPVGSSATYSFSGWYTDPSCTKKYVDGTAISSDTTLYGKWTANPKVSYTYTGTVPTGLTAPATEVATSGKGYNAQSKPSYAGYTFEGWYTDANCTVKYVDGTVLTTDITLYGKWSKNGGISTGDSWNGALWTAAFLSSAAGLSAMYVLRRKKYI